MQLRTFKKHHKWLGLFLSLFLVVFAVSGIVLNHRDVVEECELSRSYLPSDYEFDRWNNGLIRGTLSWKDSTQVLAYGVAGMWLTDRWGRVWQPYNDGLPRGVDGRGVRHVVRTAEGEVFACTPLGVYRHVGQSWYEVPLVLEDGHERLVDLAVKGDTLVVVSRSRVYWAVAPYEAFHAVTLQPSEGHDERVSLFRTLWVLHSGELFGLVGRLVVDVLGLLLLLLVLTGVAHWFFPRWIRRWCARVAHRKRATKQMQRNLWLHDRMGRYTLVGIFVVVLTGWCLRPPWLVAVAQAKVPAIPFTLLDGRGNAWHDRLRTLRYDTHDDTWLLHTSSGFYAMADLTAMPTPILHAPPVSVMGINAMVQDERGVWTVGSFAGLYEWDRASGRVVDHYTQAAPQVVVGPPVGEHICAGYSRDFAHGPLVFLYDKGTTALPMPESMRTLPMSLWQVALEAHTGRIYTCLGAGRHLVVFCIGGATLWCLWAGYRIRLRLRRAKPST